MCSPLFATEVQTRNQPQTKELTYSTTLNAIGLKWSAASLDGIST
jgi:hypothetical protein